MVKKQKFMSRLKKQMRSRILQGVLVLVPVGVTLFIMKTIFSLVAGFMQPAVRYVLGFWEMNEVYAEEHRVALAVVVSLVSILFLVMLVYLVGVISAFVVGRRVIGLGEGIVMKIPLVKSVYSASKQVVQSLSLPNRRAFKSAVALEFPSPGMLTIGFITGFIHQPSGRILYKVFVPTVPNVTTGFFEIVGPEKMQMTDLSVEDAFKMIISGGIIAPDALQFRPFTHEEMMGDASVELVNEVQD